MKEAILSVLPEALTGFLSAGVTWLFTRRKQSAEADGAELDNIEQAAGIWRNLAETLKADIKILKENQERIINENLELKTEVLKLEVKVENLTEENQKLRQKIGL